ncbi:virulence factor Mce family protein [Aeromicrobium sp. A1-2]|uniref:MCE family protein n=1 Tax=Aeromicrobium sp. A1-2 TaxID=2107713 RepID=UPI000E469728|nr:MCE family protein [Aeromicrobium sp. A1-2]AXT84359.1 virulence factor Mce family protein [Aeromicrobium sp. A1-2]
MTQRSDSTHSKIGIVSIAVLLLVMVASFSLQKLPGFRGTTFHAELADASGLRTGSDVQVAGIRVGRVNKLSIGPQRVVVDFDVKGATLGASTRASVEVKSLLGDKFLNLTPAGSGSLSGGATIPLERTDVTFDIVGTLGQLTTQTEDIDKENLTTALNSLAEVMDSAAPEVKSSFTGMSRLSKTIAKRDGEIEELLARSRNVTSLLDERKGDLVVLMKQADLVFQELQQRKQAIHDLLVNANDLAVQLKGLVKDNEKQLRPTLDKMKDVLTFLHAREDQIETLIHNYGPYVNILGNVVGSGPWFDAYVPNITGIFTGEFQPTPTGGGS